MDEIVLQIAIAIEGSDQQDTLRIAMSDSNAPINSNEVKFLYLRGIKEPNKSLKNRSLKRVLHKFITDLLIASSFLSTITSFVTGCLVKDKLTSLNPREILTVIQKIVVLLIYVSVPIFCKIEQDASYQNLHQREPLQNA